MLLRRETRSNKGNPEIANDATPLPWNLPDKETMQEMIDDEISKFAGGLQKGK